MRAAEGLSQETLSIDGRRELEARVARHATLALSTDRQSRKHTRRKDLQQVVAPAPPAAQVHLAAQIDECISLLREILAEVRIGNQIADSTRRQIIRATTRGAAMDASEVVDTAPERHTLGPFDDTPLGTDDDAADVDTAPERRTLGPSDDTPLGSDGDAAEADTAPDCHTLGPVDDTPVGSDDDAADTASFLPQRLHR